MENRSALDRIETSNFITIEERHRELNARERLEKRKQQFSSSKKKKGANFFGRTVKPFKSINFNRIKNTRKNGFGKIKSEDPLVHSMLRNLAVCIIAVLAIYGIKMIDTPITNSITAGVKQAISYELNIDQTLGKLQFVNEGTTATQAFSGVPEMNYPITGEVKTSFADSNSTGITLLGIKGATVTAAAGGTVALVGEDSSLGKYVQIKHTDAIYSTYYGLTGITVKKSDAVTSTQKIGSLNTTELLFEVKNNGRPVDPKQFIKDAN